MGANSVKKLLKYKLLRRYFFSNLLDVIMAVVLSAFWFFMLFAKPSSIIILFVIPVVIASCITLYRSSSSILRLTDSRDRRIIEGSLEIKSGVIVGVIDIDEPVEGTYDIYFESSRNELEGNVAFKRITALIVREAVEKFRPGWRRFSKRLNINPVEFEFQGAKGEKVCLDVDLRLANPSLYRKKLNGAENVLIVERPAIEKNRV